MHIVLRILLWPWSLLPLKAHYAIADFLAVILEKVVRYRRDTVVSNLSRCFPRLDYWTMKDALKQVYRHLADLIVEAVWFGGCNNPERLHRSHIVEIENPELVHDLYEKSPSVMILYSHCGNWELYGGVQSYNYKACDSGFREDNFCVVYRALSSKWMDEFLKSNRFAPLGDPSGFEGYIESKAMVRWALRNSSRKIFYNINTDQRPYYNVSPDDHMPFFFQDVHYMGAGAALACRMRMPVLFMHFKKQSRGHYVISYEQICKDASLMPASEIMRRYFDLLEADIREQPFNYLWTHRRWWVNPEDWSKK